MPVIGFLNEGVAKDFASRLAGFHLGLKEAGFVDGQNLIVEYRWGDDHIERLPAMAADLVQRRVTAIVATGGSNSTLAAKKATSLIPIVFITGSDPVRLRLVSSLARPAGNMTGVTFFAADLIQKELGLLYKVAPAARTVALLYNPNVPDSTRQPAEAQEAARALGLETLVMNASTDAEIDRAFATLQQRNVGVLVIGGDPFFGSKVRRLAALTRRHRVAAIYSRREFAEAGGLMSYGTSVEDAYREVGVYAGQILKGEKPGDLPVLRPTKFEFVINLKTAGLLGITIPSGVSAMADTILE